MSAVAERLRTIAHKWAVDAATAAELGQDEDASTCLVVAAAFRAAALEFPETFTTAEPAVWR